MDVLNCFEKMENISVTEDEIKKTLEDLLLKYADEKYPFSILKSGGGYQFLTKVKYHEIVASLLHLNAKRKLTNAAMETLSIIAYKQPITKTQIELIRGVNSDYTVNKLMEKELVEIVGRGEEVGKPLLYGTSDFFMDYFGINSLSELPKVKEFEEERNQIGSLSDVEKLSEN